MANITFGGQTIWSCTTGNNAPFSGKGWKFTPVGKVTEVIEKEAPIGEGYYLKRKGNKAVDYTIDLTYHTTNPDSALDLFDSIDQMELKTLTVPVWGSFTNCRLSNIGNINLEFACGGSPKRYLVSVSLTFRRYP